MKMMNKKGMSLIELVVVSALLSITLMAILNIINPAIKITNETNANFDASNTVEILGEQISEEVRYTLKKVVYFNDPAANGNILNTSLSNGATCYYSGKRGDDTQNRIYRVYYESGAMYYEKVGNNTLYNNFDAKLKFVSSASSVAATHSSLDFNIEIYSKDNERIAFTNRNVEFLNKPKDKIAYDGDSSDYACFS